MKRALIVGPEAEAEIAEARDWYDQRRFGLGAEFLGAVDAALAAIERNPFQYQFIWDNFAAPGFVGSLMV